MTWTSRRTTPALLAAATLLPICILAWLGVRILQQDRDVERQRRRDALEVAAGRLALDLERRLHDIEQRLARDGDVGGTVVLRRTRVIGSAGAPVLFQPDEAVDSLFRPSASPQMADAEAAEFRQRDPHAAARLYRHLAQSADDGSRATALLGLGRVLRQTGDREGAMGAYADLERLDVVTVAGQPAGLIARQARCRMMAEVGDSDGLRLAAAELSRALSRGGWAIDRATFEVYSELLEGWQAAPADDAARASIDRTEAALALWRMWRRGDLEPTGRRFVQQTSGPVLVVWAGAADEVHAELLRPDALKSMVDSLPAAQALAVSASSVDGRTLFGGLPQGKAEGITLMPRDTRLPFILAVTARAGAEATADWARRVILVSGLALAFALMLAAAYGLYRTTTRELRLARQQSDFVSAVSHEFRTPLTSMRHLTDLLVSRGVASEERKLQYYGLLAHETERLQRMVETLLSFGRIDDGAYAWHLEAIEPGDLVRDSLEEFRHEPLAKERHVVCEIEEGLPTIRADREALSRALWNLLENAAKYSDGERPIRIAARQRDRSVLLEVGDEGPGIRPDERARIFQKFVRGSDATRRGVRGVGIGLALV